MCQKFVLSNYDDSTFYTDVQNYRSKLDQNGNNLLLETNENDDVNSIVATASKYKYLIAGLIIAVGVIATIIVLKKKGSATK